MSYVWRSIVLGLDVLKEGIIWRIGDGSRVKIWEDPWLPSGTTRCPATHKGDSELNFVSELIDGDRLAWNHHLIKQQFQPADAEIMLSIPLREDSEDFVAWHFDNKGVFSVKSAYRAHVNMERMQAIRQEGQGSEATALKHEVFTKLWKVNCPPKFHHFLRRLPHNSHPFVHEYSPPWS